MMYYTLIVYQYHYAWIYAILYISYIIRINIQSNVHDIYTKEICITHKKMDFLIVFSGYLIPATSYGSKLCFIISLYFYICM